MIRILIVDDQDVTFIIDEIRLDVATESLFDPIHVNPLNFFDKPDPKASLAALLSEVRSEADSFLDVVAIDLNLGELGLPGDEDRHLALKIGEAVRDRNRSTAIILYSGTLSDYIKSSFSKGDKDGLLRRIFRTQISTFVRRNRIAMEVCSAIRDPSWLLRVDRLLMKNAATTVSPEEAEFKDRTFSDLAKAVRCQDHDGQRIAELVAEYGVSCFANLNS